MDSIRRYVTAILLLLPAVVGAAGDSEGEFAFNIFTDLAPLLALFGEQFARQFISESLTWLDHIIFAMAPLGIITAIVGAIRVSGPSWARAFIGRARESRAAAEIELMSSTSREVCEVYNGKGIVRAMGTPELTQFLLFPPEHRTDDSCGIHTLETAYESRSPLLERGDFGIRPNWCGPDDHRRASTPGNGKTTGSIHGTNETPVTHRRRVWARDKRMLTDPEKGCPPKKVPASEKTNIWPDTPVTESQAEFPFGTRFPPELRGSAPNLQLNLPSTVTSHHKPMAELWYAATAAMIIQVVIIVVCTVSTFHPPTRKIVGHPQSRYGFYLFMSGTLCLNLGMLLCSWVIERSTREHIWRKNRTPNGLGDYRRNEDYTHETLPSSDTIDRLDNSIEQLNGGQAKELLINTSELHQQPVTIETQVPGKKNEGTSLSSAQNTDRVHLFWLQQKHTVNDQDFDPFLILGGWKEEILTSSRIRHDPWNASMPIKLKWVAANKFELVTIIAALLGLAGFILQFEGLRGLAWPTAVTQLLAIFIMAFIRALIRRRLGEHLSTIPASEGHELDWLALRLVYTSGGLDPPPRYEASDTPKTTISWELMTPSPEWNDTPDNKSDFSKDGTFQNSNDTSSKSRSRLFVREGEIQTVHKDQESVARNSFIHANFPSKNSKGLFPSTSQMALKVRRRLGELTHCPGAASKEAIALAQAISLVLTELQPIRDNTTKIFTWYLETNITISNIVSDPMVSAGIDPIPMRKKPKSRDASQAEPEFESGENLITLQVRGNKHGWRAHAPDMDAILSLWMSSIANSPSITVPEDHPGQPDWLTKMASATIKYRRILGENPCHYNPTSSRESLPRSHYHIDEPFPINTDILTRDLNWWTNDPRIAALSIKNHDGSAVDKEPLEKPSTGTISLNIGFHGLQTQPSKKTPGELQHDAGETVYIVSSSPLANALAHHIFSAFMWSISKSIPPNTFEQTTVEDSELFDSSNFASTWGVPILRNKKMMKIARDIEAFGLGPVEDVLLGIIPPLSSCGILPNEVMMDVLLKKPKEYEALHDWDQASDAYVNLLKLDLDPRREDRITYEVVVELIEFLFVAKEAVDDRYGPRDCQDISINRQAKSLEAAVVRISTNLKSHKLLFRVAQQLRWFFVRQLREKKFDKMFGTFQGEQDEAFEGGSPKETLLDLVKFSPYHKHSSRQPSEFGKSAKTPEEFGEKGKQHVARADIFGWYPLHYATVSSDENTFDEVLRASQKRYSHHSLRNKAGRTPLHYAAMYRLGRIEKLADGQKIARSAAKVRSRDDSLPIHCAAREGNIGSIKKLIQYSDITAPDAFGRSPLHLAVISGHQQAVQKFLDNDRHHNLASFQSADELSRRTPLHFALIYKNARIITQLMSREQDLKAIAIPDLEDVTPISLVMAQKDGELFSHLLNIFPNPQRDKRSVVAPDSPRGCFMEILKHAVCDKHHDILKILIDHIVNRKWGEDLIFEAFSIAYREKHMDMLLTLLNIVDMLFKDNILSDAATLQENTLDAGQSNMAVEEPPMVPRLKSNDNDWISYRANNELHVAVPDLKPNLPIPDKVRNYLKSNLKLNESTMLIWAIQNGNIAFIKKLFTVGLIEKRSDKVNWNEQDSGNRSPLAWLAKVKPGKASTSDSLTLKRRENALNFIWSKWSFDQKRNALNERQGRYKKTPLMYAIKNNLESIVSLFMSAKASVREVDDHGMSALSYALRDQNSNIWKMLEKRDPDVVNEIMGHYKTTPLIDAIRSSRTDIIEFLADCSKIDPNIGDKDGDHVLSWCLFDANTEMVDILIDKFPTIDPHKANVRGLSPLMRAFKYFRDERNDTNEYLLNKLLSASGTDLEGYEVNLMLQHAVFKKDNELVKQLLDSGADPFVTDDAGRPLIVLAALCGNVELVKLVQEKTRSSKSAKMHLKLALHACVQRYEDDGEAIMNALQIKKIDPHACDSSNWSVIECASRSGNDKLERKLKGMVHTPSSPTKRKRFPLSWAISSNNPFLSYQNANIPGRCSLSLKAPFPGGLSDRKGAWLLIRADHCIPIFKSSYYWEFTVVKSPGNDPIAIGICAERSHINTLPGWKDSAAYGYHGDDGKIYTGRGDRTGISDTKAPFGEGDTVGCCVNLEDRLLFFTRMGKIIGPTIPLRDDLRGQLYPCVGLQGGSSATGTIIQANFGVSAHDFMFKHIPGSIASSNPT